MRDTTSVLCPCCDEPVVLDLKSAHNKEGIVEATFLGHCRSCRTTLVLKGYTICESE